jgi:hypothetical protein
MRFFYEKHIVIALDGHYLIHRGMHGRKNRHEMPYAQLPISGKEPSGEE